MNKKYEYGGLIYCEDDLSEEIDNYGGSLYNLLYNLVSDGAAAHAEIYYRKETNEPRTAHDYCCSSFDTLQELIDKTDVLEEENEKMNAINLFSELGYRQEFNGSNEISYHKPFGNFESVIVFDLKYQRLSFIHFDDPDAMSLDVFNAVCKQADELGWLKV